MYKDNFLKLSEYSNVVLNPMQLADRKYDHMPASPEIHVFQLYQMIKRTYTRRYFVFVSAHHKAVRVDLLFSISAANFVKRSFYSFKAFSPPHLLSFSFWEYGNF